MAAQINHVSINALRLRDSVEFFVELLHAEPIPRPNFGVPVQWLAVGATQLHLFERNLTPTTHHHVAFTVTDLAAAYEVAERRQASTARRSATISLSFPATSFSSTSATPPATSSSSTRRASTGSRPACERSSRVCGSFTRRPTRTCAAVFLTPTASAG